MQILTILCGLAALALPVSSQVQDTMRPYLLKTCLKPDQASKSRFEHLWLASYHTGAGRSDVVFFPEKDESKQTPVMGVGRSGLNSWLMC